MARFETLAVKGLPMKVYVDEPLGAGPHPAVIVAHHRWGIEEVTQDAVQRFARAGFVCAAPEHYFRRPQGEENAESLKGVRDADFRDSIEATIALLNGMASVQKGNIGVFGQCMGGRTAFLSAATFPLKACCALYSGSMAVARGDTPAPLDLLRNVDCPIIGFFGNDDQNPSPADVDRIAARLKEHGKAFTFHRYDGAGHAFQNFREEKNYRKAASDDAWSKIVPFFAHALKVNAPQPAR